MPVLAIAAPSGSVGFGADRLNSTVAEGPPTALPNRNVSKTLLHQRIEEVRRYPIVTFQIRLTAARTPSYDPFETSQRRRPHFSRRKCVHSRTTASAEAAHRCSGSAGRQRAHPRRLLWRRRILEHRGRQEPRVPEERREHLDAQVQLLATQDGLPPMFSAGGNPAEGAKLAKNGYLVDFDKALTELGVRDKISDGAVSTIKKLYGGDFTFLPFQYNIEGIFYNKQVFADNGWEVPTTWDDLLKVASEAKAAGLTPFAASGEQGWPLTRLVSGYLFRSLGADALQAVADGKAKLTDPEYVKAAAAIADLGKQGYFGDNVASLDYDAATNEFLTGKAAMIYMGSWLLGNINGDTNQIGADNVGFFKFPAVDGGAGDIGQYPANVGLPATFGSKTYTP